ncbi:hypothetical protein AVEN_126083-1 [Araneus ventricosus]|uniref:Uncharacterized protein n=1 Tax=Araneus ventricosus TaxID=182803 RepID=A0A4Y2CKL6_ARAVE|nr:hypothetical protein AVEN_126083-1 [Araneus ventricosus]
MRRGRNVKSLGFVGWLTAISNHQLSSLSHLIIGRGSKPKGFFCRHPRRPNSVRSFQFPRVIYTGLHFMTLDNIVIFPFRCLREFVGGRFLWENFRARGDLILYACIRIFLLSVYLVMRSGRDG